MKPDITQSQIKAIVTAAVSRIIRVNRTLTYTGDGDSSGSLMGTAATKGWSWASFKNRRTRASQSAVGLDIEGVSLASSASVITDFTVDLFLKMWNEIALRLALTKKENIFSQENPRNSASLVLGIDNILRQHVGATAERSIEVLIAAIVSYMMHHIGILNVVDNDVVMSNAQASTAQAIAITDIEAQLLSAFQVADTNALRDRLRALSPELPIDMIIECNDDAQIVTLWLGSSVPPKEIFSLRDIGVEAGKKGAQRNYISIRQQVISAFAAYLMGCDARRVIAYAKEQAGDNTPNAIFQMPLTIRSMTQDMFNLMLAFGLSTQVDAQGRQLISARIPVVLSQDFTLELLQSYFQGGEVSTLPDGAPVVQFTADSFPTFIENASLRSVLGLTDDIALGNAFKTLFPRSFQAADVTIWRGAEGGHYVDLALDASASARAAANCWVEWASRGVVFKSKDGRYSVLLSFTPEEIADKLPRLLADRNVVLQALSIIQQIEANKNKVAIIQLMKASLELPVLDYFVRQERRWPSLPSLVLKLIIDPECKIADMKSLRDKGYALALSENSVYIPCKKIVSFIQYGEALIQARNVLQQAIDRYAPVTPGAVDTITSSQKEESAFLKKLAHNHLSLYTNVPGLVEQLRKIEITECVVEVNEGTPFIRLTFTGNESVDQLEVLLSGFSLQRYWFDWDAQGNITHTLVALRPAEFSALVAQQMSVTVSRQSMQERLERFASASRLLLHSAAILPCADRGQPQAVSVSCPPVPSPL